MALAFVLGLAAGLALGVKYHTQIMSLIGTAEARVTTWKQSLIKEGEPKKGELREGFYEATEETRSIGEEDELPGEGDRKSARRYNEPAKAFVESGKVTEDADTTTEISPEEKRELEDAEEAGKERAKEEDPAVRRDYSKPE